MQKPLRLKILFGFFCILSVMLDIRTVQAQWVRKADAIKTRSEVTSVVYNNKLYAFTGFGNSSLQIEPSSEVYDPATDKWTLLAALPANKTVTHQGVVLIDNTIWHIGGRAGNDPGPLTSEIWIYNITTNTWSAGPQLVDPATGEPLLWGGGGAALVGRTLHVFGGFVINACDNDQDRIHLTLDVDQWLTNPMQPAPWQNIRKPLPLKRNHFSTVVLAGKIYAIGGQLGHDCKGGLDKNYCSVYNPVTDSWQELTGLPTARSHAEGGIFAIDGKIYLVAGQGNSGVNINKVTIFDPNANDGLGTWTEDNSLAIPYVCEGISAKVINNTFIIDHGGSGSSTNPKRSTYTRVLTRSPKYTLGFAQNCLNVTVAPGISITRKNLLYTIDGAKDYTATSNANWLTVSKQASGKAIQTGVDLEITINTSGLAPGNYQGTITATGTGTGPAYTPASFCVNLTVEGTAPEIETPAEHIFSGVKGTTSPVRTVLVHNTGSGDLQISEVSLSGTHATAFGLVNAPTFPLTIASGQNAALSLVFQPGSTTTGALSASLIISSNDSDEGTLSVGLYGLSTNGEQGNNEPPLDQVVKTLGYNINVGGTGLILSTGPAAIGDEVLTPLFQKAGTGNVSLKAVARYSPDDLLDFGYYTSNGSTPVLNKVATIDLDQEQTLNPSIVSGGASTFDPGDAFFGFYVGATSYAGQPTFTEDALNKGPLPHSVRIYPLKNRSGQLIPNAYLLGFEPASNGDYQDYVFEVRNVKPYNKPTSPPSTLSVVRINAGGPSQTVNGVNWQGCTGTGACNSYVTGGVAYTQKPLPTITGFSSPLSQTILQSEWTGGQANGVKVGVVAFTYNIPVVNGNYLVRLHFVELNKNSTGLRLFDVNIEGGDKELVNYDIYAEAGGIHKAIYRDFPVTITDGKVTIEFICQKENAKISAIEILPAATGNTQRSGVQETELLNGLQVAVFPNPTTGVATLAIQPVSAQAIQISVTDVLGNEVFSHATSAVQSGQQLELPLRNLPKGIHLIKVTQGEVIQVTRLVVQ